jgi:hypothetical protein
MRLVVPFLAVFAARVLHEPCRVLCPRFLSGSLQDFSCHISQFETQQVEQDLACHGFTHGRLEFKGLHVSRDHAVTS